MDKLNKNTYRVVIDTFCKGWAKTGLRGHLRTKVKIHYISEVMFTNYY